MKEIERERELEGARERETVKFCQKEVSKESYNCIHVILCFAMCLCVFVSSREFHI